MWCVHCCTLGTCTRNRAVDMWHVTEYQHVLLLNILYVDIVSNYKLKKIGGAQLKYQDLKR